MMTIEEMFMMHLLRKKHDQRQHCERKKNFGTCEEELFSLVQEMKLKVHGAFWQFT